MSYYGSHIIEVHDSHSSTNEVVGAGSPQTMCFFLVLNILDYRSPDFCDFQQWHRDARKTWIAILQPTDIMFRHGLTPMTPCSVTGGEYIVEFYLLGLLVPLHHRQDKDNRDGPNTAPYHDLHPDFVR